MLGGILFLAAVLFIGWIVFDAFKLYGTLAGAVALVLAVGAIFLPYMFWILALGYLTYRVAVPPRERGFDPNAWRREMRLYDQRRREGGSEPPVSLGVLPGEKDAHLEALLAAKNFADALKYAREQAAQALASRDYERARVYEKYLDRLRRGAG